MHGLFYRCGRRLPLEPSCSASYCSVCSSRLPSLPLSYLYSLRVCASLSFAPALCLQIGTKSQKRGKASAQCLLNGYLLCRCKLLKHRRIFCPFAPGTYRHGNGKSLPDLVNGRSLLDCRAEVILNARYTVGHNGCPDCNKFFRLSVKDPRFKYRIGKIVIRFFYILRNKHLFLPFILINPWIYYKLTLIAVYSKSHILLKCAGPVQGNR